MMLDSNALALSNRSCCYLQRHRGKVTKSVATMSALMLMFLSGFIGFSVEVYRNPRCLLEPTYKKNCSSAWHYNKVTNQCLDFSNMSVCQHEQNSFESFDDCYMQCQPENFNCSDYHYEFSSKNPSKEFCTIDGTANADKTLCDYLQNKHCNTHHSTNFQFLHSGSCWKCDEPCDMGFCNHHRKKCECVNGYFGNDCSKGFSVITVTFTVAKQNFGVHVSVLKQIIARIIRTRCTALTCPIVTYGYTENSLERYWERVTPDDVMIVLNLIPEKRYFQFYFHILSKLEKGFFIKFKQEIKEVLLKSKNNLLDSMYQLPPPTISTSPVRRGVSPTRRGYTPKSSKQAGPSQIGFATLGVLLCMFIVIVTIHKRLRHKRMLNLRRSYANAHASAAQTESNTETEIAYIHNPVDFTEILNPPPYTLKDEKADIPPPAYTVLNK